MGPPPPLAPSVGVAVSGGGVDGSGGGVVVAGSVVGVDVGVVGVVEGEDVGVVGSVDGVDVGDELTSPLLDGLSLGVSLGVWLVWVTAPGLVSAGLAAPPEFWLARNTPSTIASTAATANSTGFNQRLPSRSGVGAP